MVEYCPAAFPKGGDHALLLSMSQDMLAWMVSSVNCSQLAADQVSVSYSVVVFLQEGLEKNSRPEIPVFLFYSQQDAGNSQSLHNTSD